MNNENAIFLKFIKENTDLIKKNNCQEECDKIIKNIKMLKSQLIDIRKVSFYKKEKNIENRVFKILDNFFYEAEIAQSKIKNSVLITKLKHIFRSSIDEFLVQSRLIRRGYFKPRGYPGDYQIIEAMYNDKPISKNIGFLLDKYFLQSSYVQAVRDRKDKMKDILKQFINRTEPSNIKILNLACGSCREIRELFNEGFSTKKRISLILLDQDRQALNFAKKEIGNLPANWDLNFLQENILNFFKNKKYMLEKFGFQDLIYSIGLADYLPDSVLGPLALHSFRLLSNHGELIIAHKNIRPFPSSVSDWGADWKFIPRTANGLKQLIKKYIVRTRFFQQIFFISKKRIYFLILSKNPAIL